MNEIKILKVLKEQLETGVVSKQVSSLIKNEVSRLELTLQNK